MHQLLNSSLLKASSPEEQAQWDELVKDSPLRDTYFLPAYTAAYIDDISSAVAIVVQLSCGKFLVPVLYRPICALPFARGSALHDVQTAYGFGGILPLSSENISETDAVEFIDSLKQLCVRLGIVSCMFRLHPLMDQNDAFQAASLKRPGVTLREYCPVNVIDLTSWDDILEAPEGMSKGRRSDLNLARRELTVTITPCDASSRFADIEVFRNIYEETMRRIGASAYYFFTKEHYVALMDALAERMAIVIAWQKDVAVGAALFFADKRYAHYHLSGTTMEGRQYKANTLVLVAGAKWARDRGCSQMHLGGGSKPGDSLFLFKKSFGTKVLPYAFLTVIADADRYQELLQRRISSPEMGPLREGFFPEYRA